MPSPLILPPLGDYGRAAWLAGLVDSLSSSSPLEDANRWFDARFDSRGYTAYYAGDGTYPPYYFCFTPQMLVVAARGIQSVRQASLCIQGYAGPAFLTLTLTSGNQWIQGYADAIIQSLVNSGQGLPPHIAFAGHSAGGAALTILPSRPSWISNFVYAHPDIDTFGAPRAGIASEQGTADANSELQRWMNREDPVPLLPPRTSYWLNGLNGLAPQQCRRCAVFCHGGSGTQLNADGSVDQRTLPDVGILEAVSNLTQWLAQQETGNNFHSLITYYNRLLAKSTAPVHNPAPIHPQRVEPVADVRVTQLNAVGRTQAAAISTIERRQNAAPVQIPDQFLFRAIRLNRNWFVYYNDQQVAWAGSRRQAHALARHGNEMLRVLQRVAVVNTDAVVTAFQQYVAAAVDPANNFVPVMNTEIPPVPQ